MFEGVGVSFDVYGDQRVDKQGNLRTETVLSNMQQLVDRRIPFGAISVLSRHTLAHVKAIYRFYDRLRVRSRLLPFYMSAWSEQASLHALTYDEIVTALTSVFDAWMISENATPVDPIDEYLDYAISFMSNKPKSYYDKLTHEAVYVVDVDGSVWGTADAYDPEYRLGNLFEHNLDEILDSPARHRGAKEGNERMAAHCSGCPYFGHCPGHFVGDATAEQRRLLDDHGCPVRVVVDHIVRRLEKSDVVTRASDAHPAVA